MFDSLAMTEAGTLIAVTVLMIIIMFTFIGGLGYVIILRPRLRLRRRMTEFNLVASGAGKKNKAAANPRQNQIQQKLKELEDKANKKKQRNEIRTELLQAGLSISVRQYFILTGIAGLGVGGIAMLFNFSIVIAIPLALIGTFGLPKLFIRLMAKSRRKKFTQNFANAVDIMVRGVKSGLPVSECLTIIGRESPEPVGEIVRILVEGQKKLTYVRASTLPENACYQDDGCDVSPSCFSCRLPMCKFDDPRWFQRENRRERDRRRAHGLEQDSLRGARGHQNARVRRVVRRGAEFFDAAYLVQGAEVDDFVLIW